MSNSQDDFRKYLVHQINESIEELYGLFSSPDDFTKFFVDNTTSSTDNIVVKIGAHRFYYDDIIEEHDDNNDEDNYEGVARKMVEKLGFEDAVKLLVEVDN
jgi:hypothetical protein